LRQLPGFRPGSRPRSARSFAAGENGDGSASSTSRCAPGCRPGICRSSKRDDPADQRDDHPPGRAAGGAAARTQRAAAVGRLRPPPTRPTGWRTRRWRPCTRRSSMCCGPTSRFPRWSSTPAGTSGGGQRCRAPAHRGSRATGDTALIGLREELAAYPSPPPAARPDTRAILVPLRVRAAAPCYRSSAPRRCSARPAT
jgi:hypothetical protein